MPIFLVLLSVSYGHAQTDIFLSEYKEYITPRKCNDSIRHYLKDSSFLQLKLYNCKGKMSVKQYGRNGELLATGQYIASLDTLKEYVVVYSLSDNSETVKVHKFFQPLKEGEWIFYQNGQERRREKYKRGILVN